MDFVDVTDVDLIGVMNTVAVSIPHLPDGAAIVVTGSTAGLMPGTTDTGLGAGGSGYAWSKRTLVGYVEQMALILAARMIRVNAIHPTNVNTDLIHNKEIYHAFRPDLENPSREDVLPALTHFQAMPIPYVDPIDVSNAVLFLCCDESRYVTGQQLRVDAGTMIRWPNGPH